MVRRVQVILATGFGSGYFPWAPGTAGSLLAVFLFIPFAPMAKYQPWMFLAFLFGLTAVAVWASDGADQHFQSHDNKKIVIDEIAGYFVALAWVPYNWKTAAAAFVLFRIFDIAKPPPCKQIDQKLPGGLGVVLDDIVAGIYANIALQLILLTGWLT